MTEMIEITVQKAAIECLEYLGYTHREGNSLKRDLKKVVLEDDLRAFLHFKANVAAQKNRADEVFPLRHDDGAAAGLGAGIDRFLER